MATVLAYTSPALGHLFPMVPLLLELSGRGHDVQVRTVAGQLQTLRGLGLAATAIDERIGSIEHSDYQTSNPALGLKRAVQTFTRRASLDGPDLASGIDELRPDLLVVDINAWGALCVAEASGLPAVTFSPYLPPLRSPGLPPFGPGLAPIPGLRGRIRDGLARQLVQGVAERAMRPRVNALRSQLGLRPVDSADAFFRATSLLLITSAEPFEYHHPDWGNDILLIGASSWEPPQDAPSWLEPGEWPAGASAGHPLVLVTTSSEFQDDGVLVRSALEALAGEPVRVVATMPAGVPGDLVVPANARVERFLPHGPVLDRAAVAITHGGMGATQKALSRGVPVCAVPFGRDQLEVARRVEVSGAGTRLPARRLNPPRLRDAVHAAMRCVDGARRVAEGYVATGGAPAAADAVETTLAAGAHS